VINVICHINSDVSCPESIFHFLSMHDHACLTAGGLPRMLSRPDVFSGLRGTGKGGNWLIKPPDAKSASWGRYPESATERPQLSSAPEKMAEERHHSLQFFSTFK
jgi:hypothetical protein